MIKQEFLETWSESDSLIFEVRNVIKLGFLCLSVEYNFPNS